MRRDHYNIFVGVARDCNCVIGLREPNRHAAKWIGVSGCVPKMSSCKGKTATNGEYANHAGLVVDPYVFPVAFDSLDLERAKKSWDSFSKTMNSSFTVETSGPEIGIVKYNGSKIFSDYDLMYINPLHSAGRLSNYLLGSAQRNLLSRVQDMLNIRLGVPMIQHGPEMEWHEISCKDGESILEFRPTGFRSCFPITTTLH
jgi:hypothetical protein